MSMHETVKLARLPKRASGTVLIIEDDEGVAKSLERVIRGEGYQVVVVKTASEAIDSVMNGSFDAVFSDLHLPGASGVDVLNVVRAYDADVPLVLMTGAPTMDTAIEAVSLGVLEYLVKPATRDQVVRVLARASRARKDALHRREAVAAAALAVTERPQPDPSAPEEGLRRLFERALASLTVELEPIVDSKKSQGKEVIGFAARMVSPEPSLATEAALVVAAERLGRVPDLRRRARDLAVEAFVDAPSGATLFVDIHPSDLLDGDLYSANPPMARIAESVVLQVRGAAALAIKDLSARASVLRFVGFRIAVADFDLGADCLAQLAELAPEFVKIDARLVRDVPSSASRQRVVSAMVSMCHTLEAQAIAEGVSSAEEREVLATCGCTLLQGALVRRHSPASSKKPSVRRTSRAPLRSEVTDAVTHAMSERVVLRKGA